MSTRIEWIRLRDVPRIVEQITSWRPTRATVYGWVRRGWLKTTDHRPVRTARHWLLDCLNTHKRRAPVKR